MIRDGGGGGDEKVRGLMFRLCWRQLEAPRPAWELLSAGRSGGDLIGGERVFFCLKVQMTDSGVKVDDNVLLLWAIGIF